MNSTAALLQPLKIGNLTLKNRIMFPPMTTGYEELDGSIGARSLHFYQRLAQGGVGYIAIGDVAPVNTASPTPKLFDDSQIPAFRQLADALHRYDCKLALQIFHPEYNVPEVGRLMRLSGQLAREAAAAQAAGDAETFQAKMAQSRKTGMEARARLHHDMQHFVSEASVEELAQIRDAIAACAARAEKAGVDAVEVHGDRLLGSLCSPLLNHRSDSYGGSFENRIRYALEVVSAIKKAAPGLMIEYKLPLITRNADGSLRGKGGLMEEEAIAFARLLETAGVDMIQAAQANHTGNMGDTIPPMGTVPYCWTLPAAEKIKQAVSIPVATVGRVVTVEAGEEILRSGKADVIGYGRSLLCDPDMAVKIERGEPVRLCLNCNKGCVDALMGRKYISCVLNAENGDEETIFIRPGSGRRNVAVIGAGIAGLEAARVCALRGYQVTVWDTAEQIGGQLNIAAVPPRKAELLRAIEYYDAVLPRLGVTMKLGTACTVEEMNAADAVIVAVGAHNTALPIPGADRAKVVSAWDILSGQVTVSGHCAVIGGGLVGTETAEYLLEQNCQVTIIEMLDQISSGESSTILPTIMAHFEAGHVTQHTGTRVCAISDAGIEAVRVSTGQALTIPCDYVVIAIGSAPNSFCTDGVTVPVFRIGDCAGEKTADIANAVRTAYHTANSI